MKQKPREREREGEELMCLNDDRFRQCDDCVCQIKVSLGPEHKRASERRVTRTQPAGKSLKLECSCVLSELFQ